MMAPPCHTQFNSNWKCFVLNLWFVFVVAVVSLRYSHGKTDLDIHLILVRGSMPACTVTIS